MKLSNARESAFSRRILPFLLSGLLLSGCGASPDEMIASARGFIAEGDYPAAVIQLKNVLQEEGSHAEARFLLGKIYFERGEMVNAEKELGIASRLGYESAGLVPMYARALVSVGENDKVVAQFGETKLPDPKDQAQVLAALGDAVFTKDIDLANQRYRNALALDPENSYALVGTVRVLGLQGKPDEAMAAVNQALDISPDNAALLSMRSVLLMAKGERDAGLADLTRVIEIDPKNQGAYLTLATNLVRMGQVDEARKVVAKLEAAVGKTPIRNYLMAALELLDGKAEAARDLVQEVVRVAPDFTQGRLLAGSVFLRLGDQLQAQTNLNRVLEANPDNFQARRLLVMSYIAQRDAQRANDELSKVLSAAPLTPDTLRLAGQVALLSGDFDKAAGYFSQVVEKAPEDAGAMTRLGITRLAAGELDQGLEDLAAASAMDEGRGYADFARVTTLLRSQRFDDAVAAQAVLEKKFPDSALTRNLRGGVMLAIGDYAAAEKAFNDALEVDPTFLPAAKNLVRIHLKNQDVDGARKVYQTLYEKAPERADVISTVLDFEILNDGNPDDIRRYYDKVTRVEPEAILPRMAFAQWVLAQGDKRGALAVVRDAQTVAPQNPIVLAVLGRMLVANGDFEEGVSVLQARVDQRRNDPKALTDLAIAMRRNGDDVGAERALKSAIELDPESQATNTEYAKLLISKDRFSEVLPMLRKQQNGKAESLYAYLLEADVLGKQGKLEPGIAVLRKALEIQPNTVAAITLHKLQRAAGQSAEADKGLRSWMADHPKDLIVKAYAAEQALARNDYAEARQLYEALLEEKPENVSAINNLAWIAQQTEDPKAIEYAQKAFALAPSNPAVLDTLAMIQVEQGDFDAGIGNLLRALEIDPKATAIRLNLAKAYAKAAKKAEAERVIDRLESELPPDSPIRAETTKLRASL